ncbi:LPXTG cell wall anchor domain-containing protein [Streptomyces sp. NPDC096136]|uniref:LPXTG cell wall anchor domain-containing protein n=1 Tax=Streptomyces sp. NPDC096136 TaxID=3366076 RepID=UPI003815925D
MSTPSTAPARIRRAALAPLTALALTATGIALAGPAHAHGDNLNVVITGQRAGHVTADVTWENDGDAVDEAVAATVNAVSADGTRTQGPWKLVRDPGRAAGWTTAETLPAGTWTVTVEAGFPSLGHARKEVGVPVADPADPVASPAPSSPAPASPAAPAPVAAAAPPASSVPPSSSTASADPSSGSTGTGWWTTAGVAGIALLGAAAGILLRRARRHR